MNLSVRNDFAAVFAAVALLLVASPIAYAQVIVTIIDDHFDDGVIDTNINGIGTGFTKYQSNAGYYNEAGSFVTVIGDGARRASVESKESADATCKDAAVFRFLGVRTSAGTTNSVNGPPRLYLGIRSKEPAGYTYNASTLGHGFYVQFEADDFGGYFTGTSRLFYINEASSVTNLVTWEFDTLDLVPDGGLNDSPALDITIGLTANTWTLDITGDTQGGGSAVSFSGTNTFGGDDNHGVTNGHAYVYNQTYYPNVQMDIDRILVTTVRRPGTVICIM